MVYSNQYAVQLDPIPEYNQRRRPDGGALIEKKTIATTVDKAELDKFTKCGELFRSLAASEFLFFRNDSQQWKVALLLFAFADSEFVRSDVLRWAAFCRIDLSEQNVINALQNLKKHERTLVVCLERGKNARWRLNKQAIAQHLHLPSLPTTRSIEPGNYGEIS